MSRDVRQPTVEKRDIVHRHDDNTVTNYDDKKGDSRPSQYRPPSYVKTDKPQKKTSEEYAYEALAADMDEWKIYDPYYDDLDEWLDSNLPSVLSREDHIGSICVKTIREDDSQDSSDFQQLQNGWKELKESGEAINYYSISKLAKECNVVSGKWILHVKTGYKVDIIWRKIAKSMINGVLKSSATRANVTPTCAEERYFHVIAIHNIDYTNESNVFKLNSALREVGVKTKLLYKPDVYTHLGIYRNNEWKIRPTIYESGYDVLKKKSTVTPLYDKAPEIP